MRETAGSPGARPVGARGMFLYRLSSPKRRLPSNPCPSGRKRYTQYNELLPIVQLLRRLPSQRTDSAASKSRLYKKQKVILAFGGAGWIVL